MGLSRNGPEINVTPLIDVLLVLLVIFLVAMPAMLRMEELEVPRTDSGADPLPYLTIKVRADSSVVLVDEGTEFPLAAGDLPASLRAHLRASVHVVFVDMDDTVPWGEVVATIDTVRGVAGDTHVALKVGDDAGHDAPRMPRSP